MRQWTDCEEKHLRCIIVSVLTHEAFHYLAKIRRTRVVNGQYIETYEDPSDEEFEDSEEDEESGHEDVASIAEEGERLLCVGGQKAIKRGGKKAEVGEEVTYSYCFPFQIYHCF